MTRPLNRILKRGKRRIKVNNSTSDLLMLCANNHHPHIAKLLQRWISENTAN